MIVCFCLLYILVLMIKISSVGTDFTFFPFCQQYLWHIYLFSETHLLGPLVCYEYKMFQNAYLTNHEYVYKDQSCITRSVKYFQLVQLRNSTPSATAKHFNTYNLLVESVICHWSLCQKTYFTALKINVHSSITKMDET